MAVVPPLTCPPFVECYKYISCICIDIYIYIHPNLSTSSPQFNPSHYLSFIWRRSKEIKQIGMAIEAQYSFPMKRNRENLSSYTLLDPAMEMRAMPVKQARLHESGFPSTSGRAESMIISHFNRLNAETDTLLQLHVCILYNYISSHHT